MACNKCEGTEEIYNGDYYVTCSCVPAITSLKDRSLVQGQKVKVYFNLHKQCFSIMDVKTGLVVAHAPAVNLKNVSFKVLKSGREKVIREKKKNVHAFVIGEYQGAFVGSEENKAYYNPYKTSTFIDQDLCMLSNASSVTCVNKQIKFNY